MATTSYKPNEYGKVTFKPSDYSQTFNAGEVTFHAESHAATVMVGHPPPKASEDTDKTYNLKKDDEFTLKKGGYLEIVQK